MFIAPHLRGAEKCVLYELRNFLKRVDLLIIQTKNYAGFFHASLQAQSLALRKFYGHRKFENIWQEIIEYGMICEHFNSVFLMY